MNPAASWALEIEVRSGATREDLPVAFPDAYDEPVRYVHFEVGERVPVLLNHERSLIGMARAISTPDGVRLFAHLNGSPVGRPVRDLLKRGGTPGVSLGMRVTTSKTGRSVPSAPVTEVSLLVDGQGRGVRGGFGTDAQVVKVDRLTLAEVDQRATDYAELRSSGVEMTRRLDRNIDVQRRWRRGELPGSAGKQIRVSR